MRRSGTSAPTARRTQPGPLPLIRPATGADATTLARFAARTFRETYEHGASPADLASYIVGAFGPAQQSAEIADPAATYLLAEMARALAGYAWLRTGRAPPCGELPDPVEISRFYVAREWHGRGVAQALMAAAVAEARRRGGRTVWLGVWQKNPRAIAFYRKCGFREIGTLVWRFDSEDQDDWLMALPLDRSDVSGTA
jgi:ribosomal protein S18 acetylase RimI-like enzyme